MIVCAVYPYVCNELSCRKLFSAPRIKSLKHSKSVCSPRVQAFGRMLLSLAAAFLVVPVAQAQTSVTTQHNDIARTGANPHETILTPTNVNTNTFGKLFSYPADGWLYAQPLYMAGLTMGAGTAQAGTTHNVVFVVTEHDSVYAFDADSNSGANANPLWRVSLIGAGEKTVPSNDLSCGDLIPEYGITSTPVIDPTTNTIYVVAKTTVSDTTFIQRLHALDITTGNEKFGGPVTLSASVPGNGNGSSGGTLNWDPKWQHNRASLLLVNGIVYIGFGSHCDNGPWHGWILAYNASTLNQTGAWCSTPNGSGAGIWMGGTGLAADVPIGKPFGRMFTSTGNGIFDATAPNYTNAMNYGDSIIKLDLNNGVPSVNASGTVVGDDFTPHDQANMNNTDQDVASGGVVLLPDSVGGGGRQLVQVGKSGRIYVLNRENLGGYNPNNTKDPQESAYVGGLWGAPAYWNGDVYVWDTNDHLKAFSFVNGVLSANPTSTSSESVGPQFSPTPSVSANGTTNGIVWSLKTDNYASQGREILYAHDASNVANLLYSSESNVTRDNPGNSVKFIVPTVINGKVYVGSESQLSVFGLLSGATQAATPVINPASQSFNPSIQVTITDSTPGASIYYTIDGTTPTTASTKYSSPFTLTTTSTVNAIAAGTGLLQSPEASATYTLTTQVATPIFNPAAGYYTTVQSVTIRTTTPGATIYYTTDGTTPTTLSTKYTGPVSIGITETLSAIAVASGLSNSPVASGLYTIDLGGVSSINFVTGFASGGMNLLGTAKLNGSALELTDGGGSEAAAAWYQVEVIIQSFTTDFTFQITPALTSTADGFTFTMQGNNSTALGPSGGGLGYGPDSTAGTPGIASSVAIKFDLCSNAGEGSDSTGIYINGASPTVPAVNMTSSGVNLHSGDPFHAHLGYNGTTLSMTLTDTITNATFSQNWTIDIPGTVGGNAAYVGFTGGTGSLTATQNILTWTFSSSTGQTAAPVLSPAAGTYLGAQTVTITDTTPASSIFYTLDGTAPATTAGGSTLAYAGPITITATETINAIATASGFSPSAVASAAYVIDSQVAAPMFSPVAGTYSSPQTVTISTSSPNAIIYYTTNGTTPTTSSTLYTAPITVSTSETVQAIATASGFFSSNVSTSVYTITSGQVISVNLGSGFTAGAMLLNGSATLNGTRLRLTNGGTSLAGSAWYNSSVNIQQFTSNFSFQITGGTSPTADGFAFVIQGGLSSALGPWGGGLGYGPDGPGGTGGLANSVAVKFDLYSNAGEGVDSTGLYINGASPTIPAIDMTSSGVNLHTTDIFNVQMTYDGTNLTMVITDTTTNVSFTQIWPINIPATVGGNAAYVGFTGGTGGETAIQEITGWTMASNVGVAATPTFSPAAGTYSSAQSVTLSDTTSGASIYYTTNGSTPTTTSTLYNNVAIPVNSTETIKAIAVATGFTQSAVGSATYTIRAPAATPTFSPVTGTYSSGQSVTLSDTTSGASIYYTTNGTTPTTSSTLYNNVAIPVNSTETIKAIAVATGFTQSAVGSATYTIQAPPPPDFSVSATPASQSVAAGGSTTYTVTVGSLYGFGGVVGLSMSGLPAGATPGFNPSTVTGSGTSTLTVNTTTSTASGTYPLTITGTSGSLTHPTSITLTVNPAPQSNFSLSASPSSLSIRRGGSGTSTITVNPLNGFSGSVSLSALGLPKGVSASFNPSSTTTTSILTLTASSSASLGNFTVTVTGTSSSLSHTTTISLKVTQH